MGQCSYSGCIQPTHYKAVLTVARFISGRLITWYDLYATYAHKRVEQVHEIVTAQQAFQVSNIQCLRGYVCSSVSKRAACNENSCSMLRLPSYIVSACFDPESLLKRILALIAVADSVLSILDEDDQGPSYRATGALDNIPNETELATCGLSA